MSWEAIAAIGAVLAVVVPFLVLILRRVGELSAWRATVNAALTANKNAREDGDKRIHRRLDDVRDDVKEMRSDVREDLKQVAEREADMAKGLVHIAELAGRADGRTERD